MIRATSGNIRMISREGKPYTPNDGDSANSIDYSSWQSVQARPNGVVNVVDDRKDAPAAVNLRIVSGYFRCNQEDWGQKYRESNGCDERVCGDIDMLESLNISSAINQPCWKGYERGDNERKLGAIRKRPYSW